jgi:hypothetical protein
MIKELRVVNFTTSKNLIVKSTMFPHHNIHKYAWTSPDGNTYNHIDHILTDRRRHVRSFRAADCDMDHYLVVAKIRERLAVNKPGSHKFRMERFNLKKLNEVEGKEKYCVEVSNRCAALEDLDTEGKEKYRVEVSNRCAALEDLGTEVEINTIWETIII